MEFLVDTGAIYSVLNEDLTPTSKEFVTIKGATAQPKRAYFLKPLEFKLGKQVGIHQFLYLPDSPHHLLGRDLLEQLGAEIRFESGKMKFKVKDDSFVKVFSLALITASEDSGIPKEIINQVYPGVWATEVPGRAKNASPIVIKVKQEAHPPRIKQYPLRAEDREEIQLIID